jgi:hypothetical protein
MSQDESDFQKVDDSAAEAPDEVVDRTDQGLGNNPYANQTIRQLGEPDHPGRGASPDAAEEHVRYEPGTMTDGSTEGTQERADALAPDGEPIDPTGGTSDGAESGQDAGLSS